MRRRWMLLLALAAAAGAASLAWRVSRSSWLEVQEVRIVGAQRSQPASVPEVAGLMGQNILRLDREAVERAVEALPLVTKATLSVDLPHRVIVQVEERQPVVNWQVGSTTYGVDSEGVVVDLIYRPGLPLIFDVTERPLRSGQRVDSDALLLRSLLEEALPRELAVTPLRYQYDAEQGLSVLTSAGQWATLGDSADLARKLAVWKALLARTREDGINVHYVDLRFDNRPYFR